MRLSALPCGVVTSHERSRARGRVEAYDSCGVKAKANRRGAFGPPLPKQGRSDGTAREAHAPGQWYHRQPGVQPEEGQREEPP